MRLRTALLVSLAVLGVALTGASIAVATASPRPDSASCSPGGMHGHAMQRAELREMHRTMMRDPQMRRMHQHMMSTGSGTSGMSMHR